MRDMLDARKRGDLAFRDKDFKTAIDCYSQVILVIYYLSYVCWEEDHDRNDLTVLVWSIFSWLSLYEVSFPKILKYSNA